MMSPIPFNVLKENTSETQYSIFDMTHLRKQINICTITHTCQEEAEEMRAHEKAEVEKTRSREVRAVIKLVY